MRGCHDGDSVKQDAPLTIGQKASQYALVQIARTNVYIHIYICSIVCICTFGWFDVVSMVSTQRKDRKLRPPLLHPSVFGILLEA
jgi:hypothetical protein